MSATNHLPQFHLNLLPESSNTVTNGSAFSISPNVSDRFSQLLNVIEMFLLTCTYEEICKFWQAIDNLRHCLESSVNYSDVPQFLTDRRKQRDFCRILEVLADLSYPKLHSSNHLSPHLAKNSGDRRNSQRTPPLDSDIGYPHLSVQG
jgi:hypothetical protein